MECSYPWVIALLVGLVPATASAQGLVTTVFFNTGNEDRFAGEPVVQEPVVQEPVVQEPEPVVQEPVVQECPPALTVVRQMGGPLERVTMPLLDCDRRARPEALRAISLLTRPRTLTRPSEEEIEAFDPGGRPGFIAEGVRQVHPDLLDRLQRIGEAFEGHDIQIHSGYRPQSAATSRHHHARAVDLTVDGVERERVRDVALTFEQTGVGWYPNSVFVHVDAREQAHYWVDVSRPGEPPRYVRDALPPEPEALPPAPSSDGLDAILQGIVVPAPNESSSP